ncbi:PSD1 and planctomycete cytochrome C domain-containing protein [Singulisphaera sp. PoT]|uniref:PSD1 and planctomycete cytochrome C domain-containing protein n=1 Tax=Singulisphaera sp. PoT TaxID=3411797 RepID=UPI003BF55054
MRIGVRSFQTGLKLAACLGFGLCSSTSQARAQDAADDLPPPASRPVDYERDIKPIFARSCYKCHGAEKQKGGLALHRRDLALTGGDAGPSFETGKSAESHLIRLVAGIDDEGSMPPEGAGKPLTEDEVGLLRAWIDQGAKWPEDKGGAQRVTNTHWSFQKPVAKPCPAVKQAGWARNPIDQYILAKLEKEGFAPSREADKPTLIRRLYLDLLGLPPTPVEVDAFVADKRPDAYESLVDRLLASPHYGERWGRRWLDRARYSDTNGYEKDRDRSIWPYRDWVIQALNSDMPFNQFTIEQIAGDLLPNATTSQRIATGFHRNTMVNEEGGIDVEEFRFASLVDRVATTGTVWLGLTIQCAQCHTHKYDPITQREYYQLFAFLNNADEPDLEIPSPAIAAKRSEVEAKVAALIADRENQFPLPTESDNWATLRPVQADSARGTSLKIQADGSVLATGEVPDSDTYTIVLESDRSDLKAIRLEALTDPSLPRQGPGRTPHGNFVLTGFQAAGSPIGKDEPPVPILFREASADFSQVGYDVRGAIDGDTHTGWAIDDGSGHLNRNRTATFMTANRLPFAGKTRYVLTLDQQFGSRHVLGHFRISARYQTEDPSAGVISVEAKRRQHLETKLSDWIKNTPAFHWTPVRPSEVRSKKHATMEVQDDLSILASGDKPNNDVYEVEIPTFLANITGMRLEVLPDASLPDGGPGRAPLYSVGDFILTDLSIGKVVDGKEQPVKIQGATEDYSEENHPAALAIDDKPDTGWTIRGKTGKPHAAVFAFNEPIKGNGSTTLKLTLRQEGIHQMTIGRFRISLTSDSGSVRASGVPAEIESVLVKDLVERTSEETRSLKAYFLEVSPDLAKYNEKIAALEKSEPQFPTSLVMKERAQAHARDTFIHKRGEFLKPTEKVNPDVPAVLPPLPSDAPKDRLSFARWLADEGNPLVSRVIMNQAWQSFFGRGLVATVEDFGTRGELPSHPELLDWLALEFQRQGWSMKAMHRLMVTSATYRQDSHVTPENLARDPKNILLTRGPRFRVEAEVVRDIALSVSGLLTPKIGGPSVFPPQPDGVTNLAYGQAPWKSSDGPDRFRRGLYTHIKRTAPYAAFATMDAPTPETTCVRRERSNTPLQALTVLNDLVYVEASRALAKRVLAEAPGGLDERMTYAVRLCLGRAPQAEELALLRSFHDRQLDRFKGKALDPAKVLGLNQDKARATKDLNELATWTTVARALLNLDETITKE